ncbi:MAG: hypothetical protein WKF89_02190 [Chitinophagaceae bacterium]
MTTLGWIDLSPIHRDKVGAALDMLLPDSMVDERWHGPSNVPHR